jgi:branched-chain amino acid transport system permease protein
MSVAATGGPSRLNLSRERWGDLYRKHKMPLIFGGAAIALLLFYQYVLPHLPTSTQKNVGLWLPLGQVNTILVYIICAVGLNIVVGYAGLLDLGYVAFWAIGGYVAGWLMSSFFFDQKIHLLGSRPPTAHGVHVTFWLVLVVAALFCGLWGLVIGAPTLRLKSDYLAIVTLGFGEIIPQVFHNGDDVFGHNISNGIQGISPVDPPAVPGRIFGPFDQIGRYMIFVVITALVVFVSLRIREGRLGRAWLAIREDQLAASMMGVPLMRTKLASYAVGAMAGGIGGVIFAVQNNGVISDNFDFAKSINLLAMVVLGGMGNVWGVILGASILSWVNAVGLSQFGNTFNAHAGTSINFPSYNYFIFGSILVLMMLFRREGLLPETRTRLVLREQPRTEAESTGSDLEDVEALDRD